MKDVELAYSETTVEKMLVDSDGPPSAGSKTIPAINDEATIPAAITLRTSFSEETGKLRSLRFYCVTRSLTIGKHQFTLSLF